MASMNGCYFCKKAKPIFQKHAQEHSDIQFYIVNGPKTNFAQLVYKESDNVMKIRGYPAFVFIKDGKIQDYLVGAKIEELEKKIKLL